MPENISQAIEITFQVIENVLQVVIDCFWSVILIFKSGLFNVMSKTASTFGIPASIFWPAFFIGVFSFILYYTWSHKTDSKFKTVFFCLGRTILIGLICSFSVLLFYKQGATADSGSWEIPIYSLILAVVTGVVLQSANRATKNANTAKEQALSSISKSGYEQCRLAAFTEVLYELVTVGQQDRSKRMWLIQMKSMFDCGSVEEALVAVSELSNVPAISDHLLPSGRRYLSALADHKLATPSQKTAIKSMLQ